MGVAQLEGFNAKDVSCNGVGAIVITTRGGALHVARVGMFAFVHGVGGVECYSGWSV